jgi:hypothetical protein
MDLDTDYYSFRCNLDMNGLSVFKGTFTTVVGGDSDH